jgi:Mrp family chromosome partitioning ATPase
MKMVMPTASLLQQRLRSLNPLGRSSAKRREQLISDRPTSPFAEAFRLLALNLRVMLKDRPTKGVAILSAYPEDGRSSIAANLALAMADENAVLLVDSAPSNRSSLRRLLVPKRPESPGSRPASLPATTFQTEHAGVWLMNGANPGSPRPFRELGSTIADASRDDVFTIVDTPSALTLSDAFVLAREVGQVIYVVRNRIQDLALHRGVREQLQRLDVEILGLVVNEI